MKYKKQNRNNISRNIGEYDLTLFKEYDGSIAVRNQLLYKLGVDTALPIEVLNCSYRSLTGKAVEGNLFLCSERLDSEWIKSGHASTEAFLAAGNDPTLAKEVATMNGCWDE